MSELLPKQIISNGISGAIKHDRDGFLYWGSTNDLADAAISALTAAGLQIVPVEPTLSMCVAGNEVRYGGGPGAPNEIYKAMIGAGK